MQLLFTSLQSIYKVLFTSLQRVLTLWGHVFFPASAPTGQVHMPVALRHVCGWLQRYP